ARGALDELEACVVAAAQRLQRLGVVEGEFFASDRLGHVVLPSRGRVRLAGGGRIARQSAMVRAMNPQGRSDAPGASLARLVEIMDRLLSPTGCPWDREQTLDTLRPFLIEETYEVLDALSRNDVAGHCEELGDLLMQIVFHAALRAAEGAFAID